MSASPKFVIVEAQDLADLVRKAVREEMSAVLQGEPGSVPPSEEELARMRRKLRKLGWGE